MPKRIIHNIPNARKGYGVKRKLLKRWIYKNKLTQPYVARKLNMPVTDFKQALKEKGTFNAEQIKALVRLMGAWEAFKVLYFSSKRKRRKVYWEVFGRYKQKEGMNERNKKVK